MEPKRQKNQSRRIGYIDGNSVRKLNPDLEYQELERPLPMPRTKKAERIQRQKECLKRNRFCFDGIFDYCYGDYTFCMFGIFECTI